MKLDPESTHDLPSGAWRCRWVQGPRSELEELALAFRGSAVTGSGIDADGTFNYTGAVHPDRSVRLLKVYDLPRIPVPPRLAYLGRWDGHCLAGTWIDEGWPSNRGPFRMWPGHSPEPALVQEREQALPQESTPVQVFRKEGSWPSK